MGWSTLAFLNTDQSLIMWDSERRSDKVSGDADGIDSEALVQRVEQAARDAVEPERFFTDVVDAVRVTTRAISVELAVTEQGQETVLARSGIALLEAADHKAPATEHHFGAVALWLDCCDQRPDH